MTSICNVNTVFKNVSNIADDQLLNILESNFKMFFDWSFLNIGSWFDVSIDQSGIYGQNLHSKLLLTDDPSYSEGRVWQSIRKDWVWETGVIVNSGNPINISGIYINDAYIPYSGNTYTINYPMGRIILDTAISTRSTVELNYSYRHIQVYRSLESPWFDTLQFMSYQTDNPDISRTEDGDWSISSNHRIQMPCIIIEAVPKSRSIPYEIGSNSLLIEQDIAFHIFAENKNDRNKIMDILRLQQDNNIGLFNTNTIVQNESFPLDYNGDKINNPLMYPNLIANYKWKNCWIKNVSLYEIDSIHPGLYRGMVRCTIEIISD